MARRGDTWAVTPGWQGDGAPRLSRRRDYVSLGGGDWLPADFTACARGPIPAERLNGDGRPTTEALRGADRVANLVLAADVAASPPARVARVCVHRPGGELAEAADLRLPLAHLAREAVAANVLAGPDLPRGERLPDRLRGELRHKRSGRPVREAGYDATGRRSLDARHLAEVARVYTDALAEGEAPAKAVAEAFHVAQVTARRHVGLAREAGLLTAPREQRAKGGELTDLARQILRQEGDEP